MKIAFTKNINRKNNISLQRGFTLIEILVVVVIIGLLAGFLVPKVIGHVDSARLQTTEQNLAAISQQLRLYRLANFVYPSTEQGLQALADKPTIEPIPPNFPQGGFIEKLPKDGWGRDFQYLYPGVKKEYDLWSLGPDGLPDESSTTKDDITNWK